MQMAMIGLGRMGANMARRLMRDNHECVVYDRDAAAAATLEGEGALAASSLEDLAARLSPPRVVWMMLPAGIVGEALAELPPSSRPAMSWSTVATAISSTTASVHTSSRAAGSTTSTAA